MSVTCSCDSRCPSIKAVLEFKQVLLVSIIYLSVNLPTPRDTENPKLGRGRANNVLRHSLEMVVKEEQDLDEAKEKGGDCSKLQAALEKTVRPVLPRRVSPKLLQQRMAPPSPTTCALRKRTGKSFFTVRIWSQIEALARMS